MASESQHIDADLARLDAHTRQTLASLDHAFAADLDTVDTLERQWVLEAAQMYAAAREVVALHEAQTRAEYRTRQDNLHTAIAAQQRAISLIEQQDRLITETLGFDLWWWMVGAGGRGGLVE